MILIVSDPEDAHSRLVLKRLLEKGARAAIFDLGEVPEHAGLSAWVGSANGSRARIRRGGDPVGLDLEEVKTVWFRRLGRLATADAMSPEDQKFARHETTSFLVSLAVLLADRFWVNPMAQALACEGGHGKIAHIGMARRLGLSVPLTLATNDPDEARDFLKSLSGEAIYKPFRSPVRSLVLEGEVRQQGIFTNKLDEAALRQLDGVRHAPCIFQELIPKKLELRVTVMGKKVFACAIHSQAHEGTAVDFRRLQQMERTPHSPYELPGEVAEKLRALNAQLGIVYGAFDVIVTPDDR